MLDEVDHLLELLPARGGVVNLHLTYIQVYFVSHYVGFSADTARAAGGGIAIGHATCRAAHGDLFDYICSLRPEPAQSRYGYPLSLELTSQ